jgi:transcriptional regulator with XRE-family HTH domain
MATLFEAALLRLKGALQVTTDREVAEALGMSPNALNERKRRDSFPEDRVRALAAKLHFDAEYVIGGVAQAALEVIEAARDGKPMKKVSAEDAALLSRWHQCTPADQLLLLSLLRRLEGAPPSLTPEGGYPLREEVNPLAVHDKPRKKGA